MFFIYYTANASFMQQKDCKRFKFSLYYEKGNTMPEKIIICGSGPAGLSAALHSVERGCDTLLLEKLPRPAVKLLATGGGRCNFSHDLPEEQFMASFGRNGRFMADALDYAPQAWLLKHLKLRGVKILLQSDGCYFPASGRSSEIADAFLRPILDHGGKIFCRKQVERVVIENKCAVGVIASGEFFAADRVILAGGGTAAPALGGTSAALTLSRDAGHHIIAPSPAMAPLLLSETWVQTLSGISLDDAALTFGAGRRQCLTRGILLFTADGISGPAAIDLSRDAYRAFAEAGNLTLHLDFTPELDRDFWHGFWETERRSSPKKHVHNSLGKFLPQALARVLTQNSVGEEKLNMDLSNAAIGSLINSLKKHPLTLREICPMSRAMAMSGGVDLREVDPKTMESKLVRDLFFAGEMLDLTGPCGGYNLQFAFSSGKLAAAARTR